MDSYVIRSWMGETTKQKDMTIVSIIREIRTDLTEMMFPDEELVWEDIWEYINLIFEEIGMSYYLVEPCIHFIYHHLDDLEEDTLAQDMRILEELKKLKLPEQRTPEWFAFRQGRLTASELSYCVSQPIGSAISQKIILQKLKPEAVPYISSAATSHGTLFEPVAQMIYERLYHRELFEFGCIPHAHVDWLAASPDGISADGIMVEIKCPYSRTPKGVPSLTYYTQIQAQLEVCNLNKCDFMECVIHLYDDRKAYIRDTAPKDNDDVKEVLRNEQYDGLKREYLPKSDSGVLKGVALEIDTNKGMKYECISWNDMLTVSSKDWIQKVLSSYESKEDMTMYGYVTKYWIVKEVWITRIHRNQEWFCSIIPKAEEFWDEVLKQKEHMDTIVIPQKPKMAFVEEEL